MRGLELALALVFVLCSAFVPRTATAQIGATIYIRADGRVDPPTAPILNFGNATYKLMDMIDPGIVVERDNIVLDGVGNWILGSVYTGTAIQLMGRSNVTIKSLIIKTCGYGVHLSQCSNITVSGISFWWNAHAVSLIDSSNVTLRNNAMTNNKQTLGVSGATFSNYVNDIDTSNTIDGKPVRYWINETDETVPSSAGYVALVGCRNITVQGLNLAHSQEAISLAYTTNSTIFNNTVASARYGICLWESSVNSITENRIDNNDNAIQIRRSDLNAVTKNNMTNNGLGVYIDGSSNNVSENTIRKGKDGLFSYSTEIPGSNTIFRNNFTDNNSSGIKLYSPSNIVSSNYLRNNTYGIRLSSSNNTLRSNIVENSKYGYDVSGNSALDFINDVDDSNTIDGKPVRYWVDEVDKTIPTDPGYVALVNCKNITVQNLSLTKNAQAILLANTTGSTITRNNLAGITVGIELSYSSNENSIFENNVTNSYQGINIHSSSGNQIFGSSTTACFYGIYVQAGSSRNLITRNNVKNCNYSGIYLCSSNNSICANNVMGNGIGIHIYQSADNTIFENSIAVNSLGIVLHQSSNNSIIHNNFLNNTRQYFVRDSANIYDDGLEGNYWSDYTGLDSNHDGIRDAPRTIDADNVDNCPLMGMFYSFNVSWIDSGYIVDLISNSTISAFDVGVWIEHPENPNTRIIKFNVTGQASATGFCRIRIPTALMNATYHIFVNSTEIPCTVLPCSNSTYAFLYFSYDHSTEEVTIIPEFQTSLALSILMMTTLLAVIGYGRRHACRACQKRKTRRI